jgi:hypothetical protein
MSAPKFFIRQIPHLLKTSSHMPWYSRLMFFKSTFAFYVDHERKEKERRALPSIGQPALRDKCCALRSDRFEPQKTVKDIPELLEVLHPKGSSLYNNFFQCSVCGQEWAELWTQEKWEAPKKLQRFDLAAHSGSRNDGLRPPSRIR